jgi:hypothetical protein
MHDGMPSSSCGHLGHLGYLGIIGNLNTLNPSSLDTALTDSYCGVFITEMDPENLGPSEGYYVDNLLNPLSTATPLLPDPHIKQIDAQMGMT